MSATVDTIRAGFTYGTAFVLIIGGLLFLYVTSVTPPVSEAQDGAIERAALIVASLMGAASAFLFGAETATRTARASQAAHREGATLHANGLTGTPVAPKADYPGGSPSHG